MFTGIIEDLGKIDKIKQSGESIIMTITSNKIVSDVNCGDSIAVNGVCLTVTSFNEREFTVDLMPETVRSTSLKELKRGSKVNLERAMLASSRFGGHFVSGHVDGIGTIMTKKRVENAVYYEIEVSNELQQYLLYKGSVAVDGTSLTIFGLHDNLFTISLIPHTLSATVLGDKGVNDIVNIECDMLGKYVKQFLEKGNISKTKQQSSLTAGFLQEHGYK